MSAAGVLAAIGAGALLAGLFLDWFEPGISAWTAFEIVDLLLATIGVAVLVVALGASSNRPRLVALADWLPVGAIAALVLVAISLIDPPPPVSDRSLEIGAWVSLVGAALLVVGAVLATTELSLVITVRPRRGEGAAPVEDVAGAAPFDDVASPTSDPGWEPPPGDPPSPEPPLEDSPLEEPLVEPLQEPPVEEPPLDELPLAEPAMDEEMVEPGEPTEPVDEIIEPEDASAETRPLPPDDQV